VGRAVSKTTSQFIPESVDGNRVSAPHPNRVNRWRTAGALRGRAGPPRRSACARPVRMSSSIRWRRA